MTDAAIVKKRRRLPAAMKTAAAIPCAPPADDDKVLLVLPFSREERQYLAHLKEDDRRRLVEACQQTTTGMSGEMPLRFQVAQSRLTNKTDIMRRMTMCSEAKYEQYVRTALKVPIGRYRDPPRDEDLGAFLARASRRLNAEIYGQHDLKDEVVRMLCAWKTGGSAAGQTVLGLVGPPGVGKTSVAKAIGAAMDRPTFFVSLGGLNDVSVLSGHSYTYEGSAHGLLAQSLIETGTNSPVIVLDEVDKLPETVRAQEVVALLIHLTDPASNHAIHDRFLTQVPLDFSRACIIFTMNQKERVSPVLLDRMNVLRMGAVTFDDKVAICRDFVLPRETQRVNLTGVALSDASVEAIVRAHEHEEGVRSLSRSVRTIVETLNVMCRGGEQRALRDCAGGGARVDHIVRRVVETIVSRRQERAAPQGMYM
jgi:ATP-dependent Lon protease